MSELEVSIKFYKDFGKISEIECSYEQIGLNGTNDRKYFNWTQQRYEEIAKSTGEITLPFEEFALVLKAFILGSHGAESDIKVAFDKLDKNKDGSVDVKELHAFTPVIAPAADDEVLQDYIRELDRNKNGKLEMGEFVDFVNGNFAQRLAIGRRLK